MNMKFPSNLHLLAFSLFMLNVHIYVDGVYILKINSYSNNYINIIYHVYLIVSYGGADDGVVYLQCFGNGGLNLIMIRLPLNN